MEAIKSNTDNLSEKDRAWFTELIHGIKSDKLMLETGVASEGTKNLYKNMIDGNVLELSKQTQSAFNHVIIKDVVVDFVKELISRGQSDVSLSFNVSGSKVLVWAEIKDNDDNAESGLFLSEAKVNAKYREFNYSINTTIVEESDFLTSPPHYIDFE